MKRKILLTLLLILLVSGVVVKAKQVNVAKLDYEEDKLVVIEGNITLNFNWSTNDNSSDVQILKILHDDVYNLTVYSVKSNTISYGYDFINDTKYYHYKNSNLNDYIVSVDYSSIEVPESPMGQLLNTIKEKNETINQTLFALDNMTQNYSEALNVTIRLSSDNDELEQQVHDLQQYKNYASPIIADYNILENETINQSNQIDYLEEDIAKHQRVEREKNRTIEDLENPFCLFYSKVNGGRQESNFHFNIAWLFIGLLICLILVFVFSTKTDIFGKSKTLIDKKSEIGPKEKLISAIKGSKSKGKTETVDWNEDVPDIEKKVLKPPKKPDHEDVSKEVDKILSLHAREEIDKMFG